MKGVVPYFLHHVQETGWIVLFYDGLCTHLTNSFVELFKPNGIALVALQVFTSDQLQPLYLAVFGNANSFTNIRISKWIARWKQMAPANVALSAIDVWNPIMGGVTQGLSVSNVLSRFAKADLWPLNSTGVMQGAIRSSKQSERLLLPSKVNKMVLGEVVSLKGCGNVSPKVPGGFVCTELKV